MMGISDLHLVNDTVPTWTCPELFPTTERKGLVHSVQFSQQSSQQDEEELNSSRWMPITYIWVLFTLSNAFEVNQIANQTNKQQQQQWEKPRRLASSQ